MCVATKGGEEPDPAQVINFDRLPSAPVAVDDVTNPGSCPVDREPQQQRRLSLGRERFIVSLCRRPISTLGKRFNCISPRPEVNVGMFKAKEKEEELGRVFTRPQGFYSVGLRANF